MVIESPASSLSDTSTGSVRVRVRNLWKVFGEGEGPDLVKRVSGMSRGEAQAAYNCVVALQDVSFDVHDGETFVVMGLSGSGKSTIVRCINRLINPTTGSVFVDDDDVLAFGDEDLTNFRRTKTSMVFQQFGLLPHRTVLENTAWGLEIQDFPLESRSERAQEVLELVGLGEWGQYRPSALSGGMQQALAMVVASLVGAGGLGEDVLRGLGRFRPGEALLAGLAIVALAIILDRITQAWARERQSALRSKQE